MPLFNTERARLAAHVLRRTGWLAAALAAGAVFFCIGLLFRILIGPVSLGPFSGDLRAALAQVVPGLDVRFDDAALEWSSKESRVNLVVLGTRVFDRGQHIIAQAPKAEIGLSAGSLLRGHVVVNRIALVGVQLTLVHTKSGALRLGIESEAGGNDVLKRIRDAISRSQGGASSLKSFAVHEARLAFFDEETGAFVVAPEAELQITAPTTAAERASNSITAGLTAQIEISGKPARLYASINLPRRGDTVTGDVSISGLDLAALARNGRSFAFLTPFALKADVTGSWSLVNGTSIKYADFGIGASGYVNGFGRPLHVKSLRLVGRYDGQTGRVLIDDAVLAGEQAAAHLTGSANLAFNGAGDLDSTTFALELDKIAVNLPGTLERAVTLGRAMLRGAYTAQDNGILVQEGLVSGGALSATFAGRIGLASNQSPELNFDGKLGTIGVRDLLSYWPLRAAPGARAWIAKNFSAGRLGPVLVHTRIPAGAFEQPALPDESVSVTFPLAGATINYLDGLTPLTNVTGTGDLGGDTFKANVDQASVGPLVVTQGRVAIAQLHVHGTPADIRAHVTGQVPQFLALLDRKPLQYPSRFHIDTASAQGAGAFDVLFRVPTIRGESIDAIGISVKGTTSAFALSLGPHTKISNGALDFDVDNKQLHASGKVGIAGVGLNVDWREVFKTEGPVTTQLSVRGTLDDAARAALDLPLAKFASGPVGIDASLSGHRGAIGEAVVHLDLAQAGFGVDMLGLKKPPGTPSTAQISARLDGGGNLRNADLSVDGPGLTTRGKASFAGGALESLTLPSVRAGAANDFALIMKEQPASGLDVAISGHSLDASAIGRRKPGTGANETSHESVEPFHLSVKVDRLALRNGVSIAPFALDASGAGQRPRTLTATGNLAGPASLSASLVSEANQRRLVLKTGDAGALIKGFFGLSSIKGGDLHVDATLPSAASRKDQPDYAGTLTIKNCTLLNQPFLARLFSSGSLGGFMDLMQGQGISLSNVEIPFRVNGDVIDIHDARASGPSIGVTADGYVDRSANQLALEGAVAPLYGLNGILGVIPVLGNVFVSKQGEGVFGVTYSVRGDLDQPTITANPLSMLTPGILRRIFEGAAPTKPAAPPAQAKQSQ
ncbi:MAG TPA: AsmA-like C-terminal domain-containing protein [Rhizomicrobium sp.]